MNHRNYYHPPTHNCSSQLNQVAELHMSVQTTMIATAVVESFEVMVSPLVVMMVVECGKHPYSTEHTLQIH